MGKKISLSLVAIIISGCVLISAGLMVGAFFLLKSQKNYTPPLVEATEPPSVDEQMDMIQQQVSAIRGLEMNAELKRDMMSSAELQDVVMNDFFKDYTLEEAQQDVDVLSALGLLEPDFELLQFYIDLYSEQIAGYYDSTTKEMYVIGDAGFTGLERMTYAHEFTHVLQDQNYDLENGMKLNDDYCEIESEYCAGVTALVEGDAVLSEQYWFLSESTDQDKNDVSEFQSTYKSPVYDSAPAYMKQDFLFPYQQGFTFVQSLYADKKWKSVDAAYGNPPVSTEQILHPEKYPDEKPLKVELPDLVGTLGDGWTEIDRGVIGEWYTSLVLDSGIDSAFRLDSSTAADAAAGWGGDGYLYYDNANSEDYVFAWLSTWDDTEEAVAFFTASKEYGTLRWGTPSADDAKKTAWQDAVSMSINGDQVLWIITNDSAAYAKAMTAFQDFE
ncbi:MAG: hypothetical protein CVU42_08255 [Chloroflexi bacterium HGW-Chloroflexi-4]|jgi:hypothetical protein|nr:MAG: hypothetical protein CVU42_08255 [Chloroflexi bacterium HGW-Chloroflexi-4]